MSPMMSILIDIGILAALGATYYYWQRRKIIRVSREEIIQDLENFRFELNKLTEDKSDNKELLEFTEKFEEHFQVLNVIAILELDPTCLNEELKEFYSELSKQISGHLTINRVL
jgi:hypothetical protein